MKRNNEAGFSLVEVLVAMVVLGLTIVPMMSGMVVALKAMSLADDMMHAQLAVSSAVEELMADGISSTTDPNLDGVDVLIQEVAGEPYYNVTVTSETVQSVEVKTVIRKAGG